MSFWKSLFGGAAGAASEPAKTVEHNGFVIAAEPYPEGGQFQLAGTISKVVGGETKSMRFVRADRFAAREDAVTFTLLKGRQMIDQLGDKVFEGR